MSPPPLKVDTDRLFSKATREIPREPLPDLRVALGMVEINMGDVPGARRLERGGLKSGGDFVPLFFIQEAGLWAC